MKIKKFVDEKTNTTIIGKFDKKFSNKQYELYFNTHTGFEVLRGINGYDDPFKTILPTLLDIGIMGHCENKCHFCYQGEKEEPNMLLEDFKFIIDQVKHHTNQVALGGRGDPNLHENFEQIIEYARINKVVPNYTTSGKNLTDKQIEITKKYIGAVAVSDYRKDFSYSALKRFMDAEVKTNIHFIFSSKTASQAIDIINGKDIWKGEIDLNKLNAIIFLLFKPVGKGKKLNSWIPTNEQLEQFSNQLKSPKCKFKIGMDSCLVNKINSSSFNEIQQMSIDSCEAGRMSTYITPDMKMVPCSFANHNKFGVDIKQIDIDIAWNNSYQFFTFTHLLKNKPKCCPSLEL